MRQRVICLTGVSAAGAESTVDPGVLNRNMVLQNSVLFGSVNANRHHYELAAEALAQADPAWLADLITRQAPIGRWADAYTRQPDDIKTVLNFSDASPSPYAEHPPAAGAAVVDHVPYGSGQPVLRSVHDVRNDPGHSRPSRTSWTPMAAMRKPKTFSVTSMRPSSSLAPTWFAQRNTARLSARPPRGCRPPRRTR